MTTQAHVRAGMVAVLCGAVDDLLVLRERTRPRTGLEVDTAHGGSNTHRPTQDDGPQ